MLHLVAILIVRYFSHKGHAPDTQQGWAQIRTEAIFGQIRTGLECNFFENWRIRTGSDWENFHCFDVIILTASEILVVMRFCRIVER